MCSTSFFNALSFIEEENSVLGRTFALVPIVGYRILTAYASQLSFSVRTSRLLTNPSAHLQISVWKNKMRNSEEKFRFNIHAYQKMKNAFNCKQNLLVSNLSGINPSLCLLEAITMRNLNFL